jgi:flagellin
MSKLSVNFNPSAEYAVKTLTQLERRLERNMERISSGQRINTAQDDAAGFAVREKMRADIKVFTKGLQNLQNGVALIQTAESSLATVTDLLARMRDLAVQAASDNTSLDRDKLQGEFEQLTAEISRLAEATEFNGRKLLDGSLAAEGLRIHFGTGNSSGSDYMRLTLAGCRLDEDLQLAAAAIDDRPSALATLDAVDAAMEIVNGSRATLGAYQNRLEGMGENLEVRLENLQASEAVISDTDMAAAVTRMTRDKIVRQAAMASLAQANDLPAQAVALLMG